MRLIEYKGKKIFFACDTGPAPFYKELGKKFGPIDLGFGNLGAYNFYPIIPVKDKSTAHANPEELLSLMKDLKVKKIRILPIRLNNKILIVPENKIPPQYKIITNGQAKLQDNDQVRIKN